MRIDMKVIMKREDAQRTPSTVKLTYMLQQLNMGTPFINLTPTKSLKSRWLKSFTSCWKLNGKINEDRYWGDND